MYLSTRKRRTAGGRFWAFSTAAASIVLAEGSLLIPAIIANERRASSALAFSISYRSSSTRRRQRESPSYFAGRSISTKHHHDEVVGDGGTTRRSAHIVRDEAFRQKCQSTELERYATLLGITPDEVQARRQVHTDATQALHDRVTRLKSSEGERKHELLCAHRYRHGKHPFVCKQCWSHLPICLCPHPKLDDGDGINENGAHFGPEQKISLPKPIQNVALWTHHREWGSVTNSGCLLPLLLEDTKLYMKGLVEHDAAFQDLMSPPTSDQNAHRTNLVMVLWPDNDITPEDSPNEQLPRSRKTWDQVLDMIKSHRSNMSITLLAMEGTWRTARRMAAKLPPHVIRVALPPESIYWHKPPQYTANLALPATSSSDRESSRKMRQQDGGSPDNLCTAEAVTAALVGLGMSPDDGNRILTLLHTKIERTHQYRGKPFNIQ